MDKTGDLFKPERLLTKKVLERAEESNKRSLLSCFSVQDLEPGAVMTPKIMRHSLSILRNLQPMKA